MLRPSTLRDLSEFVQWYRAKRDLSLEDLAQDTGYKKAYIWKVEQNYYEFPVAFIKALSNTLSKEEKEILLEALTRSIKGSIVNL